MKKLFILGATLLTLSLSSCNLGDMGGGDFSIPEEIESEISETIFDLDHNQNGKDSIDKLGNTDDGIAITFEVENSFDGEVTNHVNYTINKRKNIEWGTIETTVIDSVAQEGTIVGGALEHQGDYTNYFYLDPTSGDYMYYGEGPNPEIPLNLDDIKNILTLDQGLMAILIGIGSDGTIETIAGQKCMSFIIDGEIYGNPTEGSHAKISFDLKSHLLMRFELHDVYYEAGVPYLFVNSIHVSGFKKAGEVPNFVFPE